MIVCVPKHSIKEAGPILCVRYIRGDTYIYFYILTGTSMLTWILYFKSSTTGFVPTSLLFTVIIIFSDRENPDVRYSQCIYSKSVFVFIHFSMHINPCPPPLPRSEAPPHPTSHPTPAGVRCLPPSLELGSDVLGSLAEWTLSLTHVNTNSLG